MLSPLYVVIIIIMLLLLGIVIGIITITFQTINRASIKEQRPEGWDDSYAPYEGPGSTHDLNTSLNETVYYTLSINNRTHFVNDLIGKKIKINKIQNLLYLKSFLNNSLNINLLVDPFSNKFNIIEKFVFFMNIFLNLAANREWRFFSFYIMILHRV